MCNQAEKELGRSRHEKWGERTIDIDILFYGSEQIKEDQLTIPHPELAKRGFVLRPLMDVVPTFTDPASGLMISQLFKQLDEPKDFELFSSCF